MTCITSVSYTMHINGFQGGDFKGGRGLKQGDPLSPLLFVLFMEYFTRLMQKASMQSGFSIHPHCGKLNLIHLIFANNVMIFSKAHPPTMAFIMQALHTFHQTAGLKANHSKSQIVFGGCTPQLQQLCLHITGFQEGTLPLSYLGVPITASKLSKLECRSLVEKIMGKFKLWSSRSLSLAGRAQLLNSVVFRMYNFWASIFILP